MWSSKITNKTCLKPEVAELCWPANYCMNTYIPYNLYYKAHQIFDWSQVFSRERRCSWSSADRRCYNYIWEISNFIAFSGAAYIRGLAVYRLGLFVSYAHVFVIFLRNSVGIVLRRPLRTFRSAKRSSTWRRLCTVSVYFMYIVACPVISNVKLVSTALHCSDLCLRNTVL